MVALPKTLSIPTDWLSVALPRPAEASYRLFCEIDRTPEWLAVLRSAVVTKRDRQGRPRHVAFMARLDNAAIGYSCTYHYDDKDRRVSWATPEGAQIRVQGFAQFQALSVRSCLMTYLLDVDLGAAGLPGWADPVFASHAASATLSDFRDFAIRKIDA
jgi:uncharacterized membrane protein